MADESKGKPAIPFFFASYAIDIHANEFQPTNKAALYVPQGEDLSFFSFVRETNLFSVSKFTCSPKKESEKLKNSHFGQIHVQFVLFTVSFISYRGRYKSDETDKHSSKAHMKKTQKRTNATNVVHIKQDWVI